jgi:hypothetical protein
MSALGIFECGTALEPKKKNKSKLKNYREVVWQKTRRGDAG